MFLLLCQPAFGKGDFYRSSPRTQYISKLTGHGTSKTTNTVIAIPLNNRVPAIRNLTTMLHFCLFSRFSSVSKRRERKNKNKNKVKGERGVKEREREFERGKRSTPLDSEAEAQFPVQT